MTIESLDDAEIMPAEDDEADADNDEPEEMWHARRKRQDREYLARSKRWRERLARVREEMAGFGRFSGQGKDGKR